MSDRLEEIKQREAKATPGPWQQKDRYKVWGPCRHHRDCSHMQKVADIAFHANTQFEGTKDDAEFIAHARHDIPYLLRRLEAAEAFIHKAGYGMNPAALMKQTPWPPAGIEWYYSAKRMSQSVMEMKV